MHINDAFYPDLSLNALSLSPFTDIIPRFQDPTLSSHHLLRPKFLRVSASQIDGMKNLLFSKAGIDSCSVCDYIPCLMTTAITEKRQKAR